MNIAIIIVLCVVLAAVIAFFVWQGIRHHKLVKKTEADTGIPHKRRTIREWLRAHMPSKRRLIQVYATLLYNANVKGYIKGQIYKSPTTKYMCVPGLNCYSCPGAVGACPLGAFQNALAESSVRAPYYVIGILAIFAIMFARTICGFLCPVGLVQELLYKIRTPKLRKSRVTRIFSYFKYVLLAVLVIIIPLLYSRRNVPLPGFCKYICPAGTLGGAIGLLINPKNSAMFGMLGGQFAWKFSLLIVFIVASVFIFRFFCRFFCPLGAIYGFFNRIALLGVKVDKEKCTDCGKCVTVCKMDIKRVGDHECINCGQCIPACPTQAIRWKGSKLFLHASEVETATETENIEKPLSFATEPQLAANVVADTQATATSAQTEIVTRTSAETIAPASTKTVEPKPAKKSRGKAFWLQLTAVIAALVLLVTALVYYNFIDKGNKGNSKPIETGYKVGQLAPDFTVTLCGSEDSFKLYDHRGKMTVIYFWDTGSPSCLVEIPYFNTLAEDKSDINVIAIHGASDADVDTVIAENWPNATLTFAQDNIDNDECLTFTALGGTDTWPLTVIVDENGFVMYNSTYSFQSYNDLKQLVDSFLAEEGYEVGQRAPNFTVQLYGSDDSFTLYEKRGKLTVINFWATWCTPCVAEIPYFDTLTKNKPDINVLAIHGSSTRNVPQFISEKWPNATLTFAQDNLEGNTCLTYEALGGEGMWPLTVIVNKYGIVLYNSTNSFHSYEDLEQLVESFLE
ncbi:MAG: redoxin family protein [Clostridiales bacterium]|nr:redoxin family protein [Clostridiales bacterium]